MKLERTAFFIFFTATTQAWLITANFFTANRLICVLKKYFLDGRARVCKSRH